MSAAYFPIMETERARKRMAHSKKMLSEDWIKVEDNPIQRDTERHAAKANHLRTPHPTHAFVFAAELPSGKLIKLDGHTRALLWKRKEVTAPMQVTVGIIPVKDRAEAEMLYKDFDSREALETMRDKVSGAFNRHDFAPKSGLVAAGNLTSALRIAYGVLTGGTVKRGASGGSGNAGEASRKLRKTDVYDMIDEFSYELHALDGFGLRQGFVPGGVVGAFLLSYRRYGHKITPFWQGVFANTGDKIGGNMDAIQATYELILGRRRKYGGSAAADLCARCLWAVEKWMKDEPLSSMPRPMDTLGYLVGCEKPPERLIKKKDLERAKIDRERASA